MAKNTLGINEIKQSITKSKSNTAAAAVRAGNNFHIIFK